jgi:hypothetical protein
MVVGGQLGQIATQIGKDFFGWAAWHTLHCFATTYTPDKRDACGE